MSGPELYLYGVIAVFGVFMVVLFTVSTWVNLKK